MWGQFTAHANERVGHNKVLIHRSVAGFQFVLSLIENGKNMNIFSVIEAFLIRLKDCSYNLVITRSTEIKTRSLIENKWSRVTPC